MKITRHAVSPYAAAALLLLPAATQPAWADYESTVQSYNPLAYWRFNESNAGPAPNKVANSSTLGSSADGYVVLDVGKGEPGVVGNAIRLVNNGNVVGYAGSKVDVPYLAALNPPAPFSVEFWAKPNSLGADASGFAPLSSFNPNWFGGANRSGWLFYVNNAGRWNFRLGNTGGYSASVLGSSGNAAVGVWQHIVATYDGATARLYANGVQIGSVTLTAEAAAAWTRNSQQALRIGGTSLQGNLADGPYISASGIAGNRGYDGWVDEVAVYPTALSPTTIAAHYTAASTNNAGYGAQILAANPVGYWKLDEPAATPPAPGSLTTVSNSGTAGSAADGTNSWGVVSAQPGAGYAGFGAGNRAAQFNGESGAVQLGDAPALHFSGNLTLLAWVKPTVKDFFRNIISHGWDANYAETFLRISRNNGTVFPNAGYGDGTNYYELGVTDGSTYYDAAYVPIPDGDLGNWVFLAGTYDGANWNLYRNGTLAASVPSANGALDVATRWAIGSRSNPSEAEGLFFGGGIDEPAIFNTALSAADIEAIYNSAQVPPVITRAPQGPAGSIFKGASISLSVWAEGSPTLAYRWTSNGVFTGVTTTNITINNLNVGTPTIAVIVTNAFGAVTSAVNLVVIAAPPTISQQPQPVARYAGRPFALSVTASGSAPLAYQWKLNGGVIPGATNATYTNTASPAVAGTYTVTVSNEAGPLTSSNAVLTVLPIPGAYPGAVIAENPTAFWRLGETNGTRANDYFGGHHGTYFNALLNQPGYAAFDPDTAASFSGNNSYVGGISGTEINLEGHVSFSVEAWVNGAANQADEATIIAKGNGASGTTATEQFALDVFGGKFRFFTRGSGNSLYAATAAVGPNGSWQHVVGVYDDAGQVSIYVNGDLSGTGSPRPVGVRASSAAVTIGSKHLGNDPNFDGTFNGTIDEVAVYDHTLSATTVQDHYSALYGSTTPPFVTSQPAGVTNYVGLPVTFTARAAGSVPLWYQWKKNGADIPGENANTYTILLLALTDAGDYSVAIGNAAGNTNSGVAHLTVLPAPAAPPAIPGLVVHLPFDNSLADATGRGNSGTGIHVTATTSNVVSPTYVVDGKLGKALHFETDASSTNNDYVTLGLRPDLQFSSNANFTVAFWIRSPLNYVGGDLPFISTAVGSTFGNGLVFAYTYGPATGNWPGGWALSIFDTSGVGVGGRGEIGSINDGNWHHLVHVFDRRNGNFNYLDGVPVVLNKQSGTSATAAGNIDTGNWFTIGQDPTGRYGETGAGDIDDLGVWRRALTPLEAASLYVAGASSGLSFTSAPIRLSVETATGGAIRLTWPAGTLQGADSASGPYSDVTPVSPHTVPASGLFKFYRVRL